MAESGPQGVLSGVVDLGQSSANFGVEPAWKSARVELEQEIEGWAGNPRGDSDAALRANTNEKGQFRIAGLSPGYYTLTVRAGNARPLVRHGVKVEAEGDTTLREPLILLPPIRLPVRVDPLVDPWQRPWKVRLIAETPRSRMQHLIAEAVTGDDGVALLKELDEGEANLEVRDGDGRVWLERKVDIYPDHPEVFAAIDVVAVEGRLYWGSESLAGDLSFGTTQGMTDIRMASDESGRFRGYLPKEGKWAVEILWPDGGEGNVQRLRDVEVRRRPGKSHADVEIRIPPTELRGKVLYQGEPVKEAGLLVSRDINPSDRKPGEPGIVREANLLTDTEGRFRLRGLAPGNLWLLARHGELSSGKLQFHLEESSWPEEIVIELEEPTSIRGLVVFGTQPVRDARVIALPTSPDPNKSSNYIDVRTDEAGQFELKVPAWTTRLDVLLAAPSLGVELLAIEQREGAWPSPLIALQSDRGTLRSELALAPEGADFTSGLILRRGGAAIRWSAMVRALNPLGQLELQPGLILFHGLAPGAWESCLEGRESTCRRGNLPANGELTLKSPREQEKSRP